MLQRVVAGNIAIALMIMPYLLGPGSLHRYVRFQSFCDGKRRSFLETTLWIRNDGLFQLREFIWEILYRLDHFDLLLDATSILHGKWWFNKYHLAICLRILKIHFRRESATL